MQYTIYMKCKVCEKEFEPHFSNVAKGYGKFCSSVCYQAYRKLAIASGEHRTRKRIYEFLCVNCGKKFERTGHTKHNNKFCSNECSRKYRCGNLHPRYNKEIIRCVQCNKELLRSPCYTRHKWGNFCSQECKGKWMKEHIKGSEHPQWLGGKSFEPYCPLFDETFKERVRAFFDNRCVLCGKINTKERLHVHHVNYNKESCCDDSPKQFVALCRSCHTKTNHNREMYAKRFAEMINKIYEGRSYFTVEEWSLLNPIK